MSKIQHNVKKTVAAGLFFLRDAIAASTNTTECQIPTKGVNCPSHDTSYTNLAVIGGVVAACAVVGGVFFCFKKWRERAAVAAAAAAPEGPAAP